MVVDIHSGLTLTQEKKPPTAHTSNVTPPREVESGDPRLKVVAITAVGTNLQGVSTLRGRQENENESTQNTDRNQDHQDGTNEGATDRMVDDVDSHNSNTGDEDVTGTMTMLTGRGTRRITGRR